jgi:hypothetical protein
MNPIRRRHIIFCLVVALILFILVRANDNDHPYEYPRPHNPLQSPSPSPSFDSDQSYSSFSIRTQTQSNINRHEILKKKMKGYREATYWGSEHLVQERTRYMTDDEFQTHMREEIEYKDTDVYWGTEY